MPRPSLTPGRAQANRASFRRAYERRGGTGGRGKDLRSARLRPFGAEGRWLFGRRDRHMTSILQQLQAGYETRARMALHAPESPPDVKVRRKATRTYTGQALERRRAWGMMWGAIVSERAKELT